MALLIPSFPDPRDPATPLQNAYAFISEVTFSWTGQSRLTISVNPNVGAWTGAPVGQVQVRAGEILVPAVYDDPVSPDRTIVTPAVTYPTFEELLADPEFAQAFALIGAKLQAPLLNHPRLAGATVI